MHISDGVLSGAVSAGSAAAALVILTAILRKTKREDIPKIAVMTAAFFAASLIHIRIGPASIHLVLNGLTGMILGLSSFPAVVTALLFQSLLFQHGGITALGANSIAMGIPALISWGLFSACRRLSGRPRYAPAFAFAAGGAAILLSALAVSLLLVFSGKEFTAIAKLIFAAHLPLVMIEGFVAALIAAFLIRVKPGLL